MRKPPPSFSMTLSLASEPASASGDVKLGSGLLFQPDKQAHMMTYPHHNTTRTVLAHTQRADTDSFRPDVTRARLNLLLKLQRYNNFIIYF